MNNDLVQFSEERLKYLADGNKQALQDEIEILAHIALAAKQAKPIGEIRLSEYRSDGTREASVVCLHGQADWDNFTDGTLLYLNPQPAHTEQAKSAANEFLPENLDRALTIMGVALPESKEEFNFQAQRWTQRLIDRVIRYENEFQMQESHGEKHGCKWKPDEDSVYSTSCGNEWQFTEGGLEDNKIKFCPYCSGKISAPKPESE